MTEVTTNKTFGKKTIQSLSRAVDNAVLLLLLVALLFAAYSLWDTHQVYEAAGSQKYETYKPVTEEGRKSFEELRVMNPDVMGWLTIYGTKIDYPLVKAQKDNFEYLSKNAEQEWESSGSLFVDYRNAWNFQDFNTIIHGHHMAEHAMFGDLDLFTDSDFFTHHQYANLYYEGQNHGVELFAILTIDAYDDIVQSPGIQDDNGRQALLDQIRTKAVHLRTTEVGPQDKIVIMTTCNLSQTNGRYTLVGKILDHEVANPFPEEETSNSVTTRFDVFNVFNQFMKLPVYLWILILLVLILLTWLLYRLEKRRLAKKWEKKNVE